MIDHQYITQLLGGDGTVTIHWHTDGNEGLGPDPIIGSLSIGATRDFAFLGWLGMRMMGLLLV